MENSNAFQFERMIRDYHRSNCINLRKLAGEVGEEVIRVISAIFVVQELSYPFNGVQSRKIELQVCIPILVQRSPEIRCVFTAKIFVSNFINEESRLKLPSNKNNRI